MKGRDFIITGLQSWDIPIGSNAHDIAREISLNNRVLYVNPALDPMILYRNEQKPDIQYRIKVLKKKLPNIRKLSDSLWILDFPFVVWSVNGLPDGSLFDFFNRLNNKKIFRHINKIADELGFKDIIHFIDNDIYRSCYSKEYLKPSLSVYYRRDNLQAFWWWKKHAVRIEPELIRKSDLVVCNSPQWADFARTFNPHSYDVGQGVDLSAYDPDMKFPLPKEFEQIPEPRIGYIGDINSLRLDPDLLYELAKSKPEYSFVMIGSEDKVFLEHGLHTLKNVFFPGSVPKNRVAEYMSALNVCLNPQKLNEITNGNYPRKVDEYLAMGKPVIATRTATMELFRDHVYLCTGLAEYNEAVENALADTGKEAAGRRILFARSHSWENNVNNIYHYINEVIK
jgi:glycosyltransferase involved in cell wall biosynthesis